MSRKVKYSIQDAHNLAENHGGQCLSAVYSWEHKLTWKCADGHIWRANFHNVNAGTWCPSCTWYFNEEKCRYVLQSVFKKPFPKSRSAISGYEIDGYCEELKIAFEYHGRQHYTHIKHFHKTDYEFNKQIKRDETVRIKCLKKGIRLIEIPYYITNSDDDLVTYIGKYFSKKPVVDWCVFYNNLSQLKKLRDLAMRQGGTLITDKYMGTKTPLTWECSKKHQWSAAPISIKHGSWCPVCANNLPKTIIDAQKVASSRNGECLSLDYKNNRTKLKWKCNKGHTWDATFDNIVTRMSWCPICSGTHKLSIKEMDLIAQNRGGKCVSTSYINNSSKLRWECSKGHEWEATPAHVKRGTWCPQCTQQVKPTIDDMQSLAKKREGACLSKIYVNAHTPLVWQCSKGHQWKSSPTNVKSGKWCKQCRKSGCRL